MKKTRYRFTIVGVLCVLMGIIMTSCNRDELEEKNKTESNNVHPEKEKADPTVFEEDKKNIVIPGVKDSYKFIVVNDMHIIAERDNYPEDKKEEIQARLNGLVNSSGTPSYQQWEALTDQINSYNPDAVLLAGDMVDFYSPENLECLKKGIDKIEAPVMYTRADHDYGTWYVNEEASVVNQKEADIVDNNEILTQEFPEFIIVGVNNSTSQISEGGVEKLNEIWKLNKPVILVTHVPLESKIDSGLHKASAEVWQDRALLWGENCAYEPDDHTKNYLDLVLGEDSPVAAVVSAHLHFPYTVNLTDSIVEYVFDASHKGKIGVITVSGK